jgi:DNA-binding transcriptional MerR regulator
MLGDIHVGTASRELWIPLEYSRLLERRGRIPRARGDCNGRIYSDADLRLQRALGVGSRLRRLKSAMERVEATP